MDKITSLSNSKFKNYLKIKENKVDGLILIEGEDLLDMCLESSFIVKELIVLEYLEEYKEIDQVVLSKELYRELSSYSSLPKLIAVASYSLRKPIGNRIVYLDGVQDPGNFGTIIRTALAFDYYDIVISRNTVSPTNFKCVQATKGALFKVNISYGELEYFEKQGYKLYVTCLDGKDIKDVEKVKENFVLVFGNEGKGVSQKTLELKSEHVLLPINKAIDSLNVGVAAALFMYLWR